jgi:hypothetical protein
MNFPILQVKNIRLREVKRLPMLAVGFCLPPTNWQDTPPPWADSQTRCTEAPVHWLIACPASHPQILQYSAPTVTTPCPTMKEMQPQWRWGYSFPRTPLLQDYVGSHFWLCDCKGNAEGENVLISRSRETKRVKNVSTPYLQNVDTYTSRQELEGVLEKQKIMVQPYSSGITLWVAF